MPKLIEDYLALYLILGQRQKVHLGVMIRYKVINRLCPLVRVMAITTTVTLRGIYFCLTSAQCVVMKSPIAGHSIFSNIQQCTKLSVDYGILYKSLTLKVRELYNCLPHKELSQLLSQSVQVVVQRVMMFLVMKRFWQLE